MTVKMLKKKELLQKLFDLAFDHLHALTVNSFEDIKPYVSVCRNTDGLISISANYHPPHKISVQRSVGQYIHNVSRETEVREQTDHDSTNLILQHLPDELVKSLGPESIELIRAVADSLDSSPDAADEEANLPVADPVSGQSTQRTSCAADEESSLPVADSGSGQSTQRASDAADEESDLPRQDSSSGPKQKESP